MLTSYDFALFECESDLMRYMKHFIWEHPKSLVILRRPSPSPRVCKEEWRSYGDVITKFSRLDGLTIFLTNGASLKLPYNYINIQQQNLWVPKCQCLLGWPRCCRAPLTDKFCSLVEFHTLWTWITSNATWNTINKLFTKMLDLLHAILKTMYFHSFCTEDSFCSWGNVRHA